MDSYAPVRGKCVWWREMANSEDRFDANLKPAEKRWDCSCFVEGYRWEFVFTEVPSECPNSRHCRFFVRGY
jgi:hypothetical protein